MSIYVNTLPPVRSVHFKSSSKEISHKMLSYLSDYLQNLIKELSASEKAVRMHPFSVDPRSTIRPIDCDNMLGILNDMQHSVDRLTGILRQVDDLSVMVIFNRYSLLMSLYTLQERSKKLNSYLFEFRSLCLKRSEETQRAQTRIFSEISHLLRQFGKTAIEAESILGSIILETSNQSQI